MLDNPVHKFLFLIFLRFMLYNEVISSLISLKSSLFNSPDKISFVTRFGCTPASKIASFKPPGIGMLSVNSISWSIKGILVPHAS